VTAPPQEPSRKRFEQESGADDTCYQLTLFVNGASDLSAHAIANARLLCESHLAGRYHLSVVDVHDDPDAVLRSRVLATPTLVKNRPLPVRRLVGDLSHTDKVLLALDIPGRLDASTVVS
jgi:circadian clock protein KaiB